MKKTVKKYHLKDSQQYEDEREYWRNKTPEEKLMALEAIRETWHKLNPDKDGAARGFLPQGIPSEEEFFKLLSQNEAKYLLIGGYAYAIYAGPRYTKDIDIFYSRDSENAEKMINILKHFGFGTLEIKKDDFLNEGQVIQLGMPPYRFDLLNKIEGVSFEDAWKNREISRYGEQEIYVIAKKDLIKNKQATGRKQDQLDVENLKKS